MISLIDRNRVAVDLPELGTVLCLPGLPGADSKIYDRSPYGNMGTVTGAVWKKLSSGLWYLDFDGNDDYVDCGYPSSLQMGSGDFTMSIWANITAQTNQVQAILHAGGAGGGGKRYSIYADDSDVNANSIQIQLDDDANPCFVLVPFTAWGTWTKISAVRDGNTFRSYLNGVASTTGDCSSTGSVNSPNSRPLTLGCEKAEDTGIRASFLTGSLALPVVIKGIAQSALQVINGFHREKHLFGVW